MEIRSAKYLPRDLPKRLFEEERFLFPESYGVNRVRLLVRDPEWVFAYWDVSPETMKGLAYAHEKRDEYCVQYKGQPPVKALSEYSHGPSF